MADAKKPAATAGATKTDTKTPRQRFLEVGANRVGKALKAIRNVRNITNRKSYEYSEAEARKAIAALRSELDGVERMFNEALAGKGTGGEKESFSFS
jgi:hypothetical protein